MSKERPILFSGDMVRATLDNRKTQTRRTRGLDYINKEPDRWFYVGHDPDYPNCREYHLWLTDKRPGRGLRFCTKCPYDIVGDKLYVRETWRCTGGGDTRNIIYRAEGDTPMSFCGIDDGRTGILHVSEDHWQEWDRLVYKTRKSCDWRSPIHMYKWAARIWLEITNIRVERVQDISEEDAKAEGIESFVKTWDKFAKNIYKRQAWESFKRGNLRKAFSCLWDSINDKRGFGWDENPWVWVIEFKRISDEQS